MMAAQNKKELNNVAKPESQKNCVLDRTVEPQAIRSQDTAISCRQKTLPLSNPEGHVDASSHKLVDACSGCERQRHKASSNKTVNGHNGTKSLWLTADQTTRSPSQVGTTSASLLPMVSPGDDMENYFNANAHMLQDSSSNDGVRDYGESQWPNGDTISRGIDVYEAWINNAGETGKSQTADEGVEMSEERELSISEERTAAYLCEEYLGVGVGLTRSDSNDSLYNHCTDDLYQTNLANSVEDIGDFIETDIPKNRYDYGSSDSTSSRSRTPSDDDLPTLALDPISPVTVCTGAGDIKGALSLDWNVQYNIEHAQRPPSLLVNRTSALSSDSNSCRPRTASDTDYGFFTPTSGASGSSLRTQSVQSAELSDYSATCGMTSADSSAFVSPDSEQIVLPGDDAQCVRPRNGPKLTQNTKPQRSQEYLSTSSLDRFFSCRPRQEAQLTQASRSAELDNLNLDRVSWKSSKEKNMDISVRNRDNIHANAEKRRRNKGSGTSGGASLSMLEGQSLLPSAMPAKLTVGANKLDTVHYGHNDLNPRSHGVPETSGRISQASDQFNVSRQTSTSDFDQDENSFQEIIDFPPGLLEASCPSCDEDDDDDTAFHANQEYTQPHEVPSSSHSHNEATGKTTEKSTASLAERRRVHQNLIQIAAGNADGGSIDNLLQSIQVEQIPPADLDLHSANMDDIVLPPQTPILNRQWLKKAAKYLDYNFLYKSLFKDDQSDSDSDSEGHLDDDLRESDFDLDLEAHGGDSCRDPTHIRGRKMLYSVLLKDALLKHLQDKTTLYNGPDGDSSDVKKVMLWSEYQAYILQVSQIGTSACGATAVINVLKYFDMYVEQDLVCDVIKTNMRAETASIGEYLVSRSVAGTTALELIEGVHRLSDGAIFGRFFHLFPERDMSIHKWLGDWMTKGAVPVVTLNRQRAIPKGWVVPDAWHHQMVYGVGPKGVYLTNPLEIVPVYVIQCQLSSESVLLVRRNDVVSRWHDDCDLGVLIQQDDIRWQDMNVLGQVVNVLREDRAPHSGTQCPQLTSHITVPAWYKSGVTLFVKRDSDVYNELLAMPEELPMKNTSNESPETHSSTGSSLQHLFAEGGAGSGADSGTPAKESPS